MEKKKPYKVSFAHLHTLCAFPTPPGRAGKNQDGLGREWDISGARGDPVILDGRPHQVGITGSSMGLSLSLVSLLRLCGRERGGRKGTNGCLCPFSHSSQLSNLHVSISKLTLKPKVERSLLDATKDPLKWQRLKVRIVVG